MFVLKSYFMKMLWSCLLIVGLIQPSWRGSAYWVLSAWGLLFHLQGKTNPPHQVWPRKLAYSILQLLFVDALLK